jgi:hypothetical protein
MVHVGGGHIERVAAGLIADQIVAGRIHHSLANHAADVIIVRLENASSLLGQHD